MQASAARGFAAPFMISYNRILRNGVFDAQNRFRRAVIAVTQLPPVRIRFEALVAPPVQSCARAQAESCFKSLCLARRTGGPILVGRAKADESLASERLVQTGLPAQQSIGGRGLDHENFRPKLR